MHACIAYTRLMKTIFTALCKYIRTRCLVHGPLFQKCSIYPYETRYVRYPFYMVKRICTKLPAFGMLWCIYVDWTAANTTRRRSTKIYNIVYMYICISIKICTYPVRIFSSLYQHSVRYIENINARKWMRIHRKRVFHVTTPRCICG